MREMTERSETTKLQYVDGSWMKGESMHTPAVGERTVRIQFNNANESVLCNMSVLS